jgi:FkbM family methyltransferase
MTFLKNTVQSALRSRGYELKRLGDDRSIDASNAMFRWLRGVAKIGTVVDIGANDGAFLEFLQRFFKAERSLAFEPIPAARAVLEARGIPGLTVFSQALSDAAGSTTFEINAYGPASSMLPVSELSRTEFPQTAAIAERIEVPLARLDDLVEPDTLPGGIFLKMDVQGVEDRVIAGGPRVIGRADYVMIEVSFRPMYDGQALFEDIHAPLAALGFRLAGIKNQLSAESGEPLFGHFLYRAGRL